MTTVNYIPLSQGEIGIFEEMFSTFQDLILSMIRNAVVALPSKSSDNSPNLSEHLNINKNKGYKYESFIDIKDVFLSCFSDVYYRNFINLTISNFRVNNRKKIKFCLNKKACNCLDKHSRILFKKDINKLEKIVNHINDNFNINLIEAKKQRNLLLSEINSRINKIPKKAKYIEKTNDKLDRK